MNRLQAELQRLYFPGPEEPALIGPEGRSRAMVLELARPASWHGLAKVWHGVQADLALPAPAIAVSGIDGYQLWFSFAEPLPAAQAIAFLESLRTRYLADVAPERIEMKPVGAMPPLQTGPGRWSAFVTPDLATLFADEPWLDLAPSPDAQADVLSRLKSMKREDLTRALERPVEAAAPAVTPTDKESSAPAAERQDPKGFLLGVMNDRAIDLHLRIEAAKALLPYFEGGRK